MDWVIINRPRVSPFEPRYRIAKRAMDITLCVLALPFALPIMLICALAIFAESAGPVVFVQERVGKGGRIFRMYKFRTMHNNLDDSHHRAFVKAFVRGQIQPNGDGRQVFKPIQNSQVTRVGRILRKTSLDELPQLINIFKGEMSLVGPRPNVPWEVEEYRLWHHERLEVLPGITGLAQVHGRSGITFEQIVQYDIEYVKKQSLLLDLKILWWRLRSVMLRDGAE